MKLLPKRFCKLASVFLATSVAIGQAHAQDVLVMDSLAISNRSGVENSLQGTVAGLRVKDWTGTPGTQSIINLRGLSLDPTNEATAPLILINGVPVITSPSNVTGINPLSYYSPEQIERIEILKSVDQLAAYGVQAPNGAINLIMKAGKAGPLHLRGSASAGVNVLHDFDYRTDAFYDFNSTARRKVFESGSIVHQQNILVDGGGDYGSYLFGLNNYSDEGVLKSTKFGRQSLFLNAKYNITPKLKAHFYNNLALTNRDGRYAGEYSRAFTLPVIEDETFFMDKKRNVAFLSSIGLSYQLGPGLSLNTTAGISYEGASRDIYIPSNILKGSIYASSDAYKRQLISIKSALKYQPTLSNDWTMDLTLGHELRATDNRLTSVGGSRSLESGGSNFVKVVTGYNANQTDALSDHDVEQLIGFYGIGKWSYRDDLKVNLVLRTDGSSLYQNKWGFYPAVGVVYNLANTLKLPVTAKLSAGKMGMLNRPQAYRGELVAKGDYYNGNSLGIGQLYPAFRDAKSVDVTEIDAGLSFQIAPSITFDVNYFNKTYQDFIYKRYLPNSQGIDYQYETGGKLGLSGFEFTLNGTWVHSDHFTWSSNLNLAAYNNQVKELPNDLTNTSLAYLSALSEGDPITSLVAYEGNQQKVIGNSEAKLFGGISNTLRFKNISASFVFNYASGTDVLTESFGSRYDAASVDHQFPLKNAETPYYFIQGDAKNPVYQGIRTIEPASFIRLNKAVVTYHMASLFKKNQRVEDFQLFLRGDNLATFTKYSGFNPEENVAGVRRADLSYTGTPLPVVFALGSKIVF
ncbi:outer membrane receptor protein involved in Fe transport [Dyadobacter jejuensis]|uniref:Outer membrane receptor protein involved in Fe transport n=1 Tax=Dyadobacter jejuensis TaxID=1082580 RepID=A0A316B3A8_9BACT|nr:TonB-dependent receptor plug domain-containing protein [Dyadobacter jejuensis]PWJ57047.1 outer membrane receptor protein involved in Fe transport [Dyadobacter jejuensis]